VLYIAHWDNPRLTLTRGEHTGRAGGGHVGVEPEDDKGRSREQAQGTKDGRGKVEAEKTEADDEGAAVDACAWPVISLDVLWHDPH
jgi:hypothetical protein